MYKRDQAMIQHFASQSPRNTELVAVFMIASIRTQLSTLPRIMKTYRKRGLNGLGELMPKQKEGIAYMRQNRKWLFNLVDPLIKFMKRDGMKFLVRKKIKN